MPRPKSKIPWLDTRDGVYYAFWYNERRRRTDRKSLHTRDKDEARVRFAAFLTSGIDGMKPTRAEGRERVQDVLDHYLSEHIEKSVLMPQNYRYMLRHLGAHFGQMLVSDVDIPACRAYLARRQAGEIGKTPAQASTVRRELATLTTAFNFAAKWKIIKKSDIPSLELPPGGEPRSRWLTHAELLKLRMAAYDQGQDVCDFLDVLYYTAGRRNSIETLTVFQVDFETKRISLNPPGRRRTSKRKPVLPLTDKIEPLFARLVKDAKRAGRARLFTREMYHALRNAIIAAGLETEGPNRVSPHTIRHTRATHMLMEGRPLYVVAGWLGDSTDMVIKVYGHHCPDYMREAVEEDFLGGKSGA